MNAHQNKIDDIDLELPQHMWANLVGLAHQWSNNTDSVHLSKVERTISVHVHPTNSI